MKTYFITAIRSLMRNKFFTFINLICMVIGLTCSSLLFLYVKKEMETDRFFPSHERIVRVESSWGPRLSVNQAKLLQKTLPEIEQMTLYQSSWSSQDIISFNNNDYRIEQVIYADSSFFNVLKFNSLYGDLSSSLMLPYSMVLTQSQAKRIFGNGNPVGKTILLKTSTFGIHDYTITAVMEDIPNNCSFRFNMVLSLSGLMKIDWYKQNAEHWGTCNNTGFALLSPNARFDQMNEKAKIAFLNQSPEWVHNAVPFQFSSLDGLHFSDFDIDGVFITNRLFTVRLLGAIGLLILLVAGINYFNLNRAQVEENRKQWSIRRTIGANSKQVMMHSLTTTVLILLSGILLSIFLIFTILPIFNDYTHSAFTLTNVFSPSNLVLMGLLIFFVLLFFGVAPAVITSNQSVGLSLRTNNSIEKRRRQYGLMVFQFGISMVLLFGAIFIYKQNRFMMEHDDGFPKQNILCVNQNPESTSKALYLEEEFEKVTGVTGVAFGSGLMGDFGENWGRELYYDGGQIHVNFNLLNVSYDFPKLFGLEVIDGNGFTQGSEIRQDIIVNQTLSKKYEVASVLGSSLNEDKSTNNVVGVITDIHHKNLHESIEPLALRCTGDKDGILYIRFDGVSPIQMKRSIDRFKEVWQEVSPDFPFDYQFLDAHYRDIYESEIKLMNLIVAATGLSILMAVLGLIGLAYFIIGKRTKEIGVRKVNGAKIVEILTLLNADFIKWILIAFIFAVPLAWYAISSWITNFAYKTSLNWWVFVLGGLFTLMVALLTVFVQSWRAATRNPVEVLRYE
jgi:putative ABC transport system permease protein